MAKTRRYSDRFIRRVKRQIERGLNWTQIMNKYNIPVGSMGYLIRLIKDEDKYFRDNEKVYIKPIIKVYVKRVIIRK